MKLQTTIQISTFTLLSFIQTGCEHHKQLHEALKETHVELKKPGSTMEVEHNQWKKEQAEWVLKHQQIPKNEALQ